MTKLSKDDYWDRLYTSENDHRGSIFSRGDYADYLLWEVLLKKHLSGSKGKRILEIGSAPGEFLAKLSQRFQLVPYGIDITPHGAELNRCVFRRYNIDPDHVIQSDFLSADFQARNQCAFDIVLSRGVIEHFTNLQEVIDKHLSLLAPGGLLLISIPHLGGINYFLAKMFNKETLAIHNLDIMDKKSFSRLFEGKKIKPLFCDYYGTFSFNLFNARPYSLAHMLLILCRYLQLILNVAFKWLFRDTGKESARFSPYLMFVGQKL